MDSPYAQHLGDGELSSWRNGGPTGGAGHDRSTTSQDAPRPSMESTAQSLAPSISTSNLGRRGSSAFYSPQSLNASPHATIPEPPPYLASPQTAVSHSTSIRSSVTAFSPSDTEVQSSLHSTIGGSEPSILAVANVDAMRSTSIMPQHPGAESVPMSAIYNPTPSPTAIVSEDEGDADHSPPQHTNTHLECYSRKDVYVKRWSWLYATLIVLSLYSTVFSGIWLFASIYQPRYGRGISTGKGVPPSTATLLATLGAKTIELSFVTVFVAVLGQVLTRRAFSRLSRGVTLAEMTMRNWVIQPGSMITHWDGIPVAATTFLGALTLSASFCALFYTTASDAMVSPKIIRHAWEMRALQGPVKVSYANPYYIRDTCQTPLGDKDPGNSSYSCLDVLFSGKSYNSLTAFLSEWDDTRKSQTSTMDNLSNRPTGKHNLYDNTTMDSQWIETENGDVAANFDTYKRIINNVTLALPHAGVYAAATDPINDILQPSDLLGIGEYSIKASVASPVVNVMCVNMTEDELAPLVYTQFPNARKNRTGWRDQEKPVEGWEADLPLNITTEWFNHTVVDDIFKWGEKYDRRRPIFPLYPIDYNMVTFKSPLYIDSMYLLARSTQDYTVCQFRSWMSSSCSSTFNLSGTSGGHMKAHCEDPDDKNAFARTAAEGTSLSPITQPDWINMAYQWQLAINLNGACLNLGKLMPFLALPSGITNNNASNARILTHLALEKPELNPALPSMAEALAVLATSTLVQGSINNTGIRLLTHGFLASDFLSNPLPRIRPQRALPPLHRLRHSLHIAFRSSTIFQEAACLVLTLFPGPSIPHLLRTNEIPQTNPHILRRKR
ncbi:hypothetical protein NPX13_g7764 [Xylaria arbuscula]|uniref:Uncharacterized protein n=1 Tax=Xylaria arbuscula TaxID=114810 RepID=A0A9W8N9X9_9PEZI|nr:hypothetical protein NPX13_g7764 [Xylaria arbuscula]